MMEQPRVYNTEYELIKWLKYDLEEQRKVGVKDEELVLHIGNKNSDCYSIDFLNQQYTTINIYFDFGHILKEIDNNQNTLRKDNKDYRICKYRINAKHCIFNSNFETLQVIFEKETNFFNSKFNKCNKNKIDNKFLYCKFKNSISFDKCLFDTNLFFCECIFFDKVKFCNSELNETIKFHGGGFYEAEYKDKKSNNKINIYFNNSFIKGKLVMNGNKIENTISINLDDISFESSKSLLSITNITNKIKYISFKNIIVGGIINIQNVKTEKVDFKGSIVTSGAVNPVEFKIDEFENRESALFLKNEAYARNNIIDALKYKAKEIEMHKEELKRKNNKNYKEWGDIISIELSSLYSNNGLNWIKSFLCTILFSILFFTMSYNISCIPIFIIAFISFLYVLFYNKNILNRIFISAITYIIISIVFSFIYFEGYNNINYTIKELFSFIAPTNFSQILYDKGGLSYIYNSKNILEIIFKGIFYFLGKIAFWYGSVQTIQSFRKFSKKE